MVLKVTVTCRNRRSRPKSKTLASKNQSKALNLLQYPQKSLIGSWIDRTLEEPEEMSEKTKHGSLFKSPVPTNRSTDPSLVDRLVNAVNGFDFSHYVYFLVLLSSPYPFQLKSPIFYDQCQENFDFWSKFDYLSKYMSIWCIWHEIHAIRRYIHQEFIKQSLDHKEITPNCLLI